MTHSSKYLLPLVFVIAIAIPVTNDLFGMWTFDQPEENRELHSFPEANLRYPGKFPTEFNAFYEDHFSFRAPFLKCFQFVKFHWFQISSAPSKTVIGKDGWYFLSQPELNIVAGNKDFSGQQLDAFKDEWRARKAYLDSMGIKVLWYVLPIKHYVYEDKLPQFVYVSKGVRRVSQLVDYLNEEIPGLIVDPTELLINQRSATNVYYQTDNHWNCQAGYAVSSDIIERLNTHFPDLMLRPYDSYNWVDEVFNEGFHKKTLGINSLTEVISNPVDPIEKAKPVSYGFLPPHGFGQPGEYERTYRKEDTAGLKLLVIRDSYGEECIPFLKESFSESVFIFDAWQYDLNRDIIQEIKPDIVLFLSLETHIENIIQ